LRVPSLVGYGSLDIFIQFCFVLVGFFDLTNSENSFPPQKTLQTFGLLWSFTARPSELTALPRLSIHVETGVFLFPSFGIPSSILTCLHPRPCLLSRCRTGSSNIFGILLNSLSAICSSPRLPLFPFKTAIEHGLSYLSIDSP